jgi:phosphopantothenate-cysteine ligase/phosphopantothenoylcysteine decarboxylase/phosphopantothenate--cysteine ligase
MNVLVTAGNTQTPIDRVRCITNVFSGRTGARVAMEAAARGHQVALLTSHPELLSRGAVDSRLEEAEKTGYPPLN